MKNLFLILFYFYSLFVVAQDTSTTIIKIKKEAEVEAKTKAEIQAKSSANYEVYTVADQLPEFPGGTAAMYKFVNDNIVRPDAVTKNGINGRCFTKFKVMSDGKIGNIQILKGIANCPECDKEAIRLIRSMPAWQPAKQNGRNVNCFYNLPIQFKQP